MKNFKLFLKSLSSLVQFPYDSHGGLRLPVSCKFVGVEVKM